MGFSVKNRKVRNFGARKAHILKSDFLDAKKRKRRWGDENDKVLLQAPVLLPTPGVLPSGSLKNVGRSNPELIQYAIRVFGTTDLTESQWKQCEDQIKVRCMYRHIIQIGGKFSLSQQLSVINLFFIF